MEENDDAVTKKEDEQANELLAESHRRFTAKVEESNLPAASLEKPAIIEPFTWAWLGVTLAEGAVAWIGGRLFSKLFGGDKLDLAALLRDIVEAMRSIVRAAIEENELRQLSGDLSQLETDLLHYMNAPHGRDRLEHATNNASRAVSQLATFNLAGHGAYMIALSIHVAVLQERVKVYGRSDRKNVVETLTRGISRAEQLQIDWRGWHEGRYVLKHIPRVHLPEHTFREKWAVLRDNKPIRVLPNKKSAEEVLNADLERVWKEIIYPQCIAPSESIVIQWRKLLAEL